MKLVPPRLQVAGELGHESEVRERRAGEAAGAAAPRVADVGLGDERELAVRVERALGRAGRARREDDRDRTVGVIGQQRQVRRAAEVREHRRVRVLLADRDGHHLGLARFGLEAGRSQDEPGRGPAQDDVTLGRGQAVVDARRDRAELGGREVREEVLGAGREDQRDDGAGADAMAGKSRGHFVRGPVDLRVRDRTALLGDVSSSIAEPAGRLARRLREHGLRIAQLRNTEARPSRRNPGAPAGAARAGPQDHAPPLRCGHPRVRRAGVPPEPRR